MLQTETDKNLEELEAGGGAAVLAAPASAAEITVESPQFDRFASDSPLHALYEDSRARGGHAEGAAAIERIVEYVAALGGSAGEAEMAPRIHPEGMRCRLAATAALADSIFSELPHVEAVVFFGSALRGKQEPKDFDIRLAIPYEAPEVDVFYRCMNRSENEAYRALSASAVPQEILGRPIEFTVVSSFGRDWAWGDLDFVTRGPYLAMVRGREIAPGILGPPGVFANCSSTQYRDSRPV